MGSLYVQTSGSSNNSGTTDQDQPNLIGSAATVAGAVVTLDGSPDLSALITSGATQSAINIASASNSNQTIFWITAFDNVLKTVTVTPSPTGVVSSAWNIGGRFYLGPTGAPQNARIEAALRAGDVAIFNDSPFPQAAVIWTFRNVGTSAAGFATIKGKAGTLPVLTTTSNNAVVTPGSICWVENLQLVGQGSTACITMASNAGVLYNAVVRANGGSAVNATAGAGMRIIRCDLSSVSGAGITQSGSQAIIIGNYIHDCGGDGITLSANGQIAAVLQNVITKCAGRGINLSGAPTTSAFVEFIANNTITNCGNSGLEVADADSPLSLFNNILADNGDAAGEANIEWVAGTGELVSIHGYNTVFSEFGTAPINFTVNSQIPATEFTTNPRLVDAAGGNMEIEPGSPALNTGFPGAFSGALTTGSPSQGAVVPKPASQSGQTVDTALTIRL